MRILHVITSLRIGGAEKLMVDLLPRLREAGYDVDLCVFDGIRTPFYDALEAASIKIISFRKGRSVYDIRNIFDLYSLIKQYDIVHTHNTAPQLFAAICSMFCFKVMCTTEHSTYNRRRKWKWYACVDRWMYSRYKKVICISNQAETNLRKFLLDCNSVSKICAISNGVNIDRFVNARPTDEIVLEYREKKTAVMVAGFRWEKDQDTLIRAYQYLPEDYHLLLVGIGVRYHECQTLATQIGVESRVHFLGLRTDVPSILKSVDVVVMSSHFEGLSLSNVEGMASGNPFIASDVDGLREVTQDYGVLFPHGDEKALAKLIVKLTIDENYRAEVVEKCQQRAKMFDISVMVSEYAKIYKEIL